MTNEEAKEYTRADMIRAFVQGYNSGWDQSDLGRFSRLGQAAAEQEAKELLEQGKLGREGE